MKHIVGLFLLLTVLCYVSCDNKTRHKLPEEVIKQSFALKVNRFDIDLFDLKKDSTSTKWQIMVKKYPDFFYLFTKNIINIGDSTNPQLPQLLNGFLNDEYINKMYVDVNKEYINISDYNQQFTEAFKGYHFFFPKANIPEITYFVSGYNFANVTTTNTLGIGLEMYLGSKYQPYTLMEIPVYKQRLMCKAYLVVDALQAWITTEFEKEEDYVSLLSQMLYKGKVIYSIEN